MWSNIYCRKKGYVMTNTSMHTLPWKWVKEIWGQVYFMGKAYLQSGDYEQNLHSTKS